MFIRDINKWRIEIALAEKFRDDEFGKRKREDKTLAGQNIEYFERGYGDNFITASLIEDSLTTLNIVDAIVSVVVPSLYFRNPRTVATPGKIESEDTCVLAAKTIDYYRRKLEIEEVNRKVIWDAYVLGFGVYKTGYVTKFGMNIADDTRKKPSVVDRALQAIGLKKKEEEIVYPETDYRIISENPFVEYVNPFDYGRDPRATSIYDASYVYHRIRKTVKSLKENRKYKNTADIKGDPPEDRMLDFSKISESELEDFHTRDLYEVHYRNEGKAYLLCFSANSTGDEREHYHAESIYSLNEWQFDELRFKNHGHTSYPKSDITKIKNLQDRITTTIDAILEQVDRFVPKIAYNSGDLTAQGKNALENGGIGATVECNRNPNEVFRELNFTQLKTDLQVLIDQLITLITIQTGITRAQLTGISNSGSATEAQIEQGGQTLRLSDMNSAVQAFVNRQSRKLWKIIKQFVDLTELNMINGIKGIDEATGLPKYDWLTVNPQQAEKLINGEYDFDIEVGSSQKVDIAMVRKSFENLFNILARTEVIVLMQQQGDKVVLSEMLRRYLDLFPELGVDSGKIIQKISQQTTGLIPPEVDARGGTTSGSNNNALESQRAQAVPTQPQEISASY